jgi:hypothetical protein
MTKAQRICAAMGVLWAISVLALSVGHYKAAIAEHSRVGQAGQFSHERK